ncbi:MAG: DUF4230 domain-containing protein [Acidimicrobiia bacterium]|nr:DUF4230 domain-containing protein [Acidimicrobiia bacterium]
MPDNDHHQERAMADSPRRASSILVIAVLIAGVFFIVANLANWGPFKGLGGEPYTQVGPTVVESVRDVAKLTTVEMVEYTTVEKGNDFGWLNWARGDRIFLFAVARIGGGVDMERVTTSNFEVDENTGSVTVQLPPAEIIFVEVDSEATQVYDRDTGLFTKGDSQLETEARQIAEEILVKSALEHGILEKAQANARTTIEGLLMGVGYTEVTFVEESSL